jgi:hypothetical protein
MSRLSLAVAVALTVALQGLPATASGVSPALVAISRCNGQTIDEASGRVRDFDRHPPGKGLEQLTQRYGALVDVMAVLGEERSILASVCSSDAQRDAFFNQIAATLASALLLEADVAARLNASCPAAATALPTMMIADAWLTLANVINLGNGVVPAVFNDVIPKVRTHADGVGLSLPPWSETSQYWRDQIHTKEKAAIATCPSPAPSSPQPSPSPS